MAPSRAKAKVIRDALVMHAIVQNSCPVAVHRFRESMVEELASLRADDDAERSRAEQRLAVSREVRAAVVQSQETALLRLRDQGVIDDQAYNNLLLELDRTVVSEAKAG